VLKLDKMKTRELYGKEIKRGDWILLAQNEASVVRKIEIMKQYGWMIFSNGNKIYFGKDDTFDIIDEF